MMALRYASLASERKRPGADDTESKVMMMNHYDYPRARFRRVALACAAVLATACSSRPASTVSGISADSVRRFTQAFYDWYVPMTHGWSQERTVDIALRARPEVFDSALARALTADSHAQSLVPNNVVGLNFDPLLATQDPCSHYEILRPDISRRPYQAWIHGDCVPAPNHPRVIAELEDRDGRLVFVNFRYPPSGADLLGILRDLENQRSAAGR
jgi:hypothetical protein